MEDVLDVYQRPYDPARPQVCLDETSKQLLEHTRVPIAARPGTLARVDDEYKRGGTATIFAAVEPVTGRGLVQVTERRAAVDMARFLRRISDEEYPMAKMIVLVMDNLNVHGLPCLYEAFKPAEARRLTQRFEIHHTPKHGSWLNVAETFLSMRSASVPGPAHRKHQQTQGGRRRVASLTQERQGASGASPPPMLESVPKALLFHSIELRH